MSDGTARRLGMEWRRIQEERVFDEFYPDTASVIRCPALQPGRAWIELLGFVFEAPGRYVWEDGYGWHGESGDYSREATERP